VRKLLVASQKSGVGKSTTSINLAAASARAGARVLLVETDPLNNISSALNLSQHPQRKPVRESGVQLPGILARDVIPNLDIFSPYDEGICTDEDLDKLLHLLTMDVLDETYDCLIVNAPPFFGGRAGPLLACCDEFIVVMQVEPLAYRTMPAFLEMVQRAAQGETRFAKMRGILLTLPEGETIGGRWERELRGRFGGRVLSQVVPYDPEAGKASLFGQVLVQVSPEAPAAVAYQQMVGELQLGKEVSKGAPRPIETTLSLAAAAVLENPPPLRAPPAPSKRKSSTRMARLRVPAPVSPSLGGDPPDAIPHVPLAGEPEQDKPQRPAPPLSRPSHSLPEENEANREPSLPRLHSTQSPGLIWVGSAIAAGVGLRFVQLPDFALPMIVGLAVAAGMTLVLHILTQGEGEEKELTYAESASPTGSGSRQDHHPSAGRCRNLRS
jgi:chromosome partitioning protein